VFDRAGQTFVFYIMFFDFGEIRVRQKTNVNSIGVRYWFSYVRFETAAVYLRSTI
jgi:hypothetical protein